MLRGDDAACVERWNGFGHYPHLVAPNRRLELLEEFEATLKKV